MLRGEIGKVETELTQAANLVRRQYFQLLDSHVPCESSADKCWDRYTGTLRTRRQAVIETRAGYIAPSSKAPVSWLQGPGKILRLPTRPSANIRGGLFSERAERRSQIEQRFRYSLAGRSLLFVLDD